MAIAKEIKNKDMSRNIIEIDNISTVYFTEMLARKLAVYPRHGFATAYFFVAKTDIAVFIVRLKVKYLSRLKTKGIVAVLDPKRTVFGIGFKIIVESGKEYLPVKRL